MSFNMNTQHLEQQIRQKFYEILRHVISMDFDSTIFTIMNQEKLLEYLERIKRLKIDTDKLWEWIRSNDFPSLTLQQSYTMPLIQLTAKIERIFINLQLYSDQKQRQQQQQNRSLILDSSDQSIVQFRSQPPIVQPGRSLLNDYATAATLLDFEQPIIPLIIEEERNGIVTTTTTTTSMDGNSKKVVVTTKNVGKKNSSKQQQQQQEEAETSLSNSTYYSTNSEFNNADFEDDDSSSDDSSNDSDDDDENFTGVSSCSTPYFHRRIDEKSRDCEEDDEEEDDDDDDDDSSDPETLNICDLSSFNDSYQTFSTVTIDEVDNQNHDVANENDTFTGDNPENGDNSATTILNKEVEQGEKILQSDSGIQNIDGTQSTRAGSETEQKNKILCNSSQNVKNDDNGSGDHISTLNIVHENLTNEQQQQSNEQANCSGDVNGNENENENEKVNKQQQQQKDDKLIQLIQLILENLMEKEKLNELIAQCLINHPDNDGLLLSFQLNTINGLKRFVHYLLDQMLVNCCRCCCLDVFSSSQQQQSQQSQQQQSQQQQTSSKATNETNLIKMYAKFISYFNSYVQTLNLWMAENFQSLLLAEMKCYYRQELYDYDDHNGCFIESNNDDNNNNNVGNEHQQTPKKFVQNNQFAKLFLRNSNPTERSVLKKRYLINLNLIAELYHIQYLPIDYLVECLNHICERNEQIQQKHLKNLDYLRLVRLFIENIRPNIDQLSNESLQQAKYYRLICKRLDKILKYQTTMMMAAAAAAVDDHEDDNIVDYKGSISMMNNQSSSTTAKSQTFAMKISKLLDSINNNNSNNNDQVIERRHYSF